MQDSIVIESAVPHMLIMGTILVLFGGLMIVLSVFAAKNASIERAGARKSLSASDAFLLAALAVYGVLGGSIFFVVVLMPKRYETITNIVILAIFAALTVTVVSLWRRFLRAKRDYRVAREFDQRLWRFFGGDAPDTRPNENK